MLPTNPLWIAGSTRWTTRVSLNPDSVVLHHQICPTYDLKLNCVRASLSDTMQSLISFRKSTPPQNLQLNILIIDSQQQIDDFVSELTF